MSLITSRHPHQPPRDPSAALTYPQGLTKVNTADNEAGKEGHRCPTVHIRPSQPNFTFNLIISSLAVRRCVICRLHARALPLASFPSPRRPFIIPLIFSSPPPPFSTLPNINLIVSNLPLPSRSPSVALPAAANHLLGLPSATTAFPTLIQPSQAL